MKLFPTHSEYLNKAYHLKGERLCLSKHLKTPNAFDNQISDFIIYIR